MATIWTVEDEETISVLLVKIIKSMGHESVHCYDSAELEHQLKKGLPDLMLLDLMLRGRSGYQILADWKADPRTRDIPVIILSARSTDTDKVKGLELGAEDYITKPFSVRELKARINTALRRVSPAALQIELGGLLLRPDERQVLLDGQTVSLTAQEFELLHYLAKHAGLLVTRAQLLQDVWGYQSQTDTSRTVDYHIRSLRKKLGDDAANPRFIQTVHGGGYRLIKES
ncbi:MAG TPA: response regulator transcription factor [Clostridia bacterium]|nr:response regulator transcription factor [Clostridia bacterium]HQA97633.1 response regulator transcription factor [Clostridia bacterium]HQO55791.1 response regulator transcription factor [Clostridia bacterium]